MDRETAIEFTRRIESAFKHMGTAIEFVKPHLDDSDLREFGDVWGSIVCELDLGVLEVIYRAYPDLRPRRDDAGNPTWGGMRTLRRETKTRRRAGALRKVRAAFASARFRLNRSRLGRERNRSSCRAGAWRTEPAAAGREHIARRPALCKMSKTQPLFDGLQRRPCCECWSRYFSPSP